jgi:hypothetical protein
VAPWAPASQAKRSIDVPSFQTLVAAFCPIAPAPQRAHLSGMGRDLALRTSSLRLSVVLLI